jgi:hypothetical protein
MHNPALFFGTLVNKTKNMKKKIKLIDNTFTKSEARFLLGQLIDEKINFHKLHRLSVREGNDKTDTSFDDGRIVELENLKQELRDMFRETEATEFEIYSEIKIKAKK